jgi:hypothetical protein
MKKNPSYSDSYLYLCMRECACFWGSDAQKARRFCAPAACIFPWQVSHSAAPTSGGAGPPQIWQKMCIGGGVEPRGGESGTGFSLYSASGARAGHERLYNETT